MRNVIAEQEWNREIIANSVGTIDCQIKNEMGEMSVTLIADRSYKAIILRERSLFVQSDIVFTIDFPDGQFNAYFFKLFQYSQMLKEQKSY